MPSDRELIKTTHVYTYTSNIHGKATIMLHHTSDSGNTAEFLSHGMLSDTHGHWSIDDEVVLKIRFNCREGVRRPQRGGEWPLHPTVLWREVDTNNWSGYDDKGAAIMMEHARTLRSTKTPGQRAKSELIDAL